MKTILLITLLALILCGCATTVRYFPYTQEKFHAKSSSYFVTVYPDAPKLPDNQVYTIIGKVEVSGHISDGVTHEVLLQQAKAIARKKGADAIINAQNGGSTYNGMYVIPGHVSYHTVAFRHHEELVMAQYHRERYVPYSDTILTLSGDLIIFKSTIPAESK